MPITMIKHKQILCMFFSYRKCMKITTTHLVQNSKGKYKIWVAKSLGYGFRVDSFFPDSWGGEFTVDSNFDFFRNMSLAFVVINY